MAVRNYMHKTTKQWPKWKARIFWTTSCATLKFNTDKSRIDDKVGKNKQKKEHDKSGALWKQRSERWKDKRYRTYRHIHDPTLQQRLINIKCFSHNPSGLENAAKSPFVKASRSTFASLEKSCPFVLSSTRRCTSVLCADGGETRVQMHAIVLFTQCWPK